MVNTIFFKYRVFWHVLFWLVSYLFYSVSYGEYNGNYELEFKSNLLLLPIRMLGTYSLIYFLIPRFLLKRKFFQFSIYTSIQAILYGFSIWMIFYLIPLYGDKSAYPVFYWPKIFVAIITNYELPFVAATIMLFKTWYKEQNLKQSLISEKKEAELNFLKTQIHPHFLFNTLNNLYALTLKQSKDAPDVVLKLSDLLRYMLYDCSVDYVPMHKELDFISNFMDLQGIRHHKSMVDISFKQKGEAKNSKIAPLLLLPIIENCFKHGADKGNQHIQITINIDIDDSCLHLHTCNTLNEDLLEIKEGLGLKNVRRRLELLYPNKHSLLMDIRNNEFIVDLKINHPS